MKEVLKLMRMSMSTYVCSDKDCFLIKVVNIIVFLIREDDGRMPSQLSPASDTVSSPPHRAPRLEEAEEGEQEQ